MGWPQHFWPIFPFYPRGPLNPRAWPSCCLAPTRRPGLPVTQRVHLLPHLADWWGRITDSSSSTDSVHLLRKIEAGSDLSALPSGLPRETLIWATINGDRDLPFYFTAHGTQPNPPRGSRGIKQSAERRYQGPVYASLVAGHRRNVEILWVSGNLMAGCSTRSGALPGQPWYSEASEFLADAAQHHCSAPHRDWDPLLHDVR
jgi:hypothetical protein